MSIEQVRSADGTSIAYEVVGHGPSLILAGGAFCDRSAPTAGTPLAARLAHRFTVFSYDRRGRGDSGDAPAYAIEREVEDLAALAGAAGGSAFAFGMSSGALLALDAAAHGVGFPKLVLYEPPLILDSHRAAALGALAQQLHDLAAEGRRSEAAERFLTQAVQVPAPAVAGMRASPMWAGLERLAHTLTYDARISARGSLPLEQARTVRAATLVLDGGASPPWMREANQALASAIPGATYRTLEGQTHAVDPGALARAIEEFLSAG